MFKLIEKTSAYIAEKISNTDKDFENYDYYEYSLIGIFSFILYCIIAIILSLLLGYFKYIFFIIPILLCLRSQSGGSHAQTPFWCCIWTSFMYLLIGLSIIYLNKYYVLFFIISILGYVGLEEVPKYTKTATQHKKEKQLVFRNKYILRLNSICLFNIICLIFIICFDLNFEKISTLLSMCIIINRFSLSDFSFYILEQLK